MPLRESSESGPDPFLDVLEDGRVVFCVNGSRRVKVENLRPQARKLLAMMTERNRANRHAPAICSYADLCALLWPHSDVADGVKHLARLVLEVRTSIGDRSDPPKILQNVAGRGYLLATKAPRLTADAWPFIVGRPVDDARRFFGRVEEVELVTSLWRTLPIEHAAIIGPRRSGKTSLLKYLRSIHAVDARSLRPGQRSDWLPDRDQYRFLHIDFLDPRARHRELLLPWMLRELGIEPPRVCSLETFMECLHTKLDAPAIVLLDEAEAGFAEPRLGTEFWGALRALGTMSHWGLVGFVIALLDRPGRAVVEFGKQSPFLNIFRYLPLGPLTFAEVSELMDSSPEPFPAGDREWILRESERWPHLVQLLCDARLRSLEGSPGPEWRQGVLERLARHRAMMDSGRE